MDDTFFLVSKLAWIVISAGNLLAFLSIIVLVLLWRHAGKKLKVLMLFLCLSLLSTIFLPIGEWLLVPLENRFATNPKLPDKVDGIIVLSGSELRYYYGMWQQVELNSNAERGLYFIHLAKKYPAAKLVFTGGSGNLLTRKYSEADVARTLYEQHGVDISRVIFEDKSRNTYENAKLSKKLAQPTTDETWVLITSASHMPRAVGVFNQLNWQVIPYPVDHNTQKKLYFHIDRPNFSGNLKILEKAIKEWVGLTAYYITGKTDAWFPNR